MPTVADGFPQSGFFPADGDHNGIVEGLDYNIWQNGQNQPNPTFETGDYNLNGVVDGLDYSVWSNAYNHTYTNTTACQWDWSLDALGNWTAYTVTTPSTTTPQTRTHNEANEMTAINSTGTNLDHDAAGNMTNVPVPGSETAAHYDCTYDAWNRLATVRNSSGTVIQVNRYDGLGRRIAKAAFNSTSTAYDRTDFYYSESWQVLEERKATGVELATATSATATTPYAQYVWDGRYLHSPACRFRDSDGNGSLDETLFYCNDANFNVTALVDSVSGTVVERYQYDPYGQPTIYDSTWTNTRAFGDASSKQNELLFTGHRWDPETGLYHTPMRYYQPPLGKWSTRDPSGYSDSMNSYDYARCGPANVADPEGLRISRSEIGGTYADFAKGGGGGARYIYTCNCGWLDRDHIDWSDLYNSLLAIQCG